MFQGLVGPKPKPKPKPRPKRNKRAEDSSPENLFRVVFVTTDVSCEQLSIRRSSTRTPTRIHTHSHTHEHALTHKRALMFAPQLSHWSSLIHTLLLSPTLLSHLHLPSDFHSRASNSHCSWSSCCCCCRRSCCCSNRRCYCCCCCRSLLLLLLLLIQLFLPLNVA